MKKVQAVLCAALLAAGTAAAQDKACSKSDAAAAEKAIDRVVSWPTLYKAWQDYGHCDSGPVDELFTDAVLRLTVEWKSVDSFAGDMQRDGKYKQFVHRHLKSPAAKDDRDAIYSRAKASCPAKLDGFCGELADVVKPEAK